MAHVTVTLQKKRKQKNTKIPTRKQSLEREIDEFFQSHLRITCVSENVCTIISRLNAQKSEGVRLNFARIIQILKTNDNNDDDGIKIDLIIHDSVTNQHGIYN